MEMEVEVRLLVGAVQSEGQRIDPPLQSTFSQVTHVNIFKEALCVGEKLCGNTGILAFGPFSCIKTKVEHPSKQSRTFLRQ